MPNWCDNWLHVSGTKEDIDRFENMGFRDGKWKLSHYLPMPEELKGTVCPCPESKELVAKYGVSNWYDWNMREYGCKWDCETEYMNRNQDGTVADLTFESPWSPPIEFVENVQRMFPELDFRLAYMEIGCWFAGVAETHRDCDGVASISVRDTDPEYRDENGTLVDCTSDTFNDYKREHEVRLVNPYETGLYYECEPDE